jgi:hypothetical protein
MPQAKYDGLAARSANAAGSSAATRMVSTPYPEKPAGMLPSRYAVLLDRLAADWRPAGGRYRPGRAATAPCAVLWGKTDPPPGAHTAHEGS